MIRPAAMLAAAVLAAGLQSPFKEEHPASRQAREALAAGKPEQALETYGALEKQLGERPDVESGRGAALLGLEKNAEAAEAYEKARKAPEPLGSRALLGLGNALAGQGNLEGAIAATREALTRDPGYADARYDLEVLLRRKKEASGASQPKPEQKPDPSNKGNPGGGGGQGGEQGGADAGPSKEQQPGQPKDQAQQQPKQGAGAGSPQEAGKKEEKSQGGAAGGKLAREEAERLLDAMRARERNLPVDATRRRASERSDVAKDW